jgi:hypothetical protein
MARDTLRLKAPHGADEANFGTTSYPIENDGTVTVSRAAAAALLERGGFSLADTAPAPERGFANVRHVADPSAGLSFDGASYDPDEDGILTVPVEAVATLGPHGFYGVPEEDKPVKKTKAAKVEVLPASTDPSDDFDPRAAELAA